MNHALVGVDIRRKSGMDVHVAVCICGYTAESIDLDTAVQVIYEHVVKKDEDQ